MDSVYNYIIKPKNSRYNNTKKVGKKRFNIKYRNIKSSVYK